MRQIITVISFALLAQTGLNSAHALKGIATDPNQKRPLPPYENPYLDLDSRVQGFLTPEEFKGLSTAEKKQLYAIRIQENMKTMIFADSGSHDLSRLVSNWSIQSGFSYSDVHGLIRQSISANIGYIPNDGTELLTKINSTLARMGQPELASANDWTKYLELTRSHPLPIDHDHLKAYESLPSHLRSALFLQHPFSDFDQNPDEFLSWAKRNLSDETRSKIILSQLSTKFYYQDEKATRIFELVNAEDLSTVNSCSFHLAMGYFEQEKMKTPESLKKDLGVFQKKLKNEGRCLNPLAAKPSEVFGYGSSSGDSSTSRLGARSGLPNKPVASDVKFRGCDIELSESRLRFIQTISDSLRLNDEKHKGSLSVLGMMNPDNPNCTLTLDMKIDSQGQVMIKIQPRLLGGYESARTLKFASKLEAKEFLMNFKGTAGTLSPPPAPNKVQAAPKGAQ